MSAFPRAFSLQTLYGGGPTKLMVCAALPKFRIEPFHHSKNVAYESRKANVSSCTQEPYNPQRLGPTNVQGKVRRLTTAPTLGLATTHGLP
jgi:hypothetical protein